MQNDRPAHPSRSYRLLEILPAFLTLGTFAGITLFSLIAPVVVASLVLIYVIYWFAKSLLMGGHLIAGYRAYRRAVARNWLKELDTHPVTAKHWQDIYHLVIIANAKEELPILESTMTAIAQSAYPRKRIIVILATEERYREQGTINGHALKRQFGETFGGFFVTTHPKDLPGEYRGKGANITYAAKEILPELHKLDLNFDNILVTTLDADNRVHPQFLAALTTTFMMADQPHLKSYQPLPMFFNNIWLVPFVIRSISIGSSFWQMLEATRPYRLRNFSAQSQSLKLLQQTDFWSTQTIVEDGHQYWRSFFATAGRHSVMPIFIPIFQDAVLSPHGQLMTYQEQYLQKRRWAWGASDVPYVLTNLWQRRRELPLSGWLQAWRLIEGHFSWAATSLILAVFGWFPIWFNHDFRQTVLAFNFINVYQRTLTVAMVGMVINLIISRLMLPPRPKHQLTSNDFLEWILTPFVLPVTNILFGSLPAIDAQIRLALGKYLGFRVTEKATARHALPAETV